jgi:hypothetical protein
VLQTPEEYNVPYGFVMEVLQLCDVETMYTCNDSIHYLNPGYSSYGLDFLFEYVGARKFETSGKVILDTIEKLLKQKMKLSFYAYNNNSFSGEFSEYQILPNKVDFAVNQLRDHERLFSMKKIVVDLTWFRYMHNPKKGKTVIAFPIGLFYRTENRFTNKPRLTQYFLKIEYKDVGGATGNPNEVKKFIDMLKTNRKPEHIEI